MQPKKPRKNQKVVLTNQELVRRVPLFSTLSDQQIAQVADMVVKRSFKRGQTIVEQGQKTNTLFILLTGRARVVMTYNGREAILATLNPGDHIGEMSMIDDAPHSATVRADIQTETLALNREAFMQCLPDGSSMAYAIMYGLVQRLRRADSQIGSLALMDVYGRVAHALMDFSVDKDNGERIIQERISRQNLARMVGASREMVSRVIKGLEESNFIKTQKDGSILLISRNGP